MYIYIYIYRLDCYCHIIQKYQNTWKAEFQIVMLFSINKLNKLYRSIFLVEIIIYWVFPDKSDIAMEIKKFCTSHLALCILLAAYGYLHRIVCEKFLYFLYSFNYIFYYGYLRTFICFKEKLFCLIYPKSVITSVFRPKDYLLC